MNNITEKIKLLKQLEVPQIELAFDKISGIYRVTMISALSVLLQKSEELKPIFDSVKEITLDSFNLEPTASLSIYPTTLTLKSLTLKSHSGYKAVLHDCNIATDLNKLLTKTPEQKISAAVKKALFSIDDNFINELISRNMSLLNQNNVEALSVRFINGQIRVKGTVKKVANLNFEFEILTKLNGNRLILELTKLNILKFLPIPMIISDLVMVLAGPAVKSKFIKLEDSRIILNIGALIPPDIEFQLKDIKIGDGLFEISCET